MADALSLACTIIQIIQYSNNVLVTLRDFCSNTNGAPKVLRHIEAQLHSLISTLTNLKEEDYLVSLAKDSQAQLEQVVEGCQDQI